MSSRSAWVTAKVPGQPGFHRETLSQANKQMKKNAKQELSSRTDASILLKLF
jgi:hypothetical protein